jgi:hypothetical protein
MVRRVCGSVLRVVLLVGCFLAPATAHADQINFNSGAILTQVVTIGGSNMANIHGQVQAGALAWTWAGTPPAGFAQTFFTFCVDLAHYVTGTQQVQVQTTTGFSNGVAGGGSKAAWLVNNFAPSIFQTSNTTTARINAAALQLAIWEATYDSTANLSGGGFTATAANTAITTQANQYLDALYKSNMYAVGTILNSNLQTGQDQIIAQVSEPSTLLLMGLAFFGFAVLARRPVAS